MSPHVGKGRKKKGDPGSIYIPVRKGKEKQIRRGDTTK